MSNYKVEFTLKQHTPIIHFQSDQIGATLRATELKPKFDRFLKKYAFNDTFETYKTFLIGYDKNKNQTEKDFEGKEAFDYKITIIANNEKFQSITKKAKKFDKNINEDKIVEEGFPTFFATMGKEWKNAPKYFVYCDYLKINIISFDSRFIEIIKNAFKEFIFNTNFGTRQSKGFGSFSVDKINNKNSNYSSEKLFFDINLNQIDKQIFNFVKYLENPDIYYQEQKKLFEAIDIFYKTIRSGINIKNKFYFKSLLFMYAKSKGITWDKKLLKNAFISKNDINKQIEEHRPHYEDPLLFQSNKSFLIRDLLGLSTTQEWLSYKLRVRHPKEKGIDELNGIKIKENNIKRFKSPITIKPIKIENSHFRIYIILNDINENIFKEKITILNTKFGKEKKEIIHDKLENLQFWSDFNLFDFFKYINEQINISSHVDEKFKKHPYYKFIIDIYSNLKPSYKE
ncbi:hypothetical protein [Aliarcobacter butzleri]|uniref:hypothetical protein n=1 Tax=Aliarcobacter butzleri TaxID=28197 RepID=UPI0021B19913|nr:hypothetical protein [Aliarcobacter butzleri]MCT7586797.1 hypothetical protein [Aliarcobacter butzleri]